MRVVFAGTPEFAQVALARLHEAGFEIPLVFTQPDRPAGRGMKLQASPVKQFALDHGLTVAQPRSLRLEGKYPEDAAAAQQALVAAGPDVMVVAAYGLILPQWTLDLPRLGCLNIHASLLPRWRGAAPIHRAIEAGDAETGVTLMQMDAGLDTGDMLFMERLPIAGDETTGTLHDKLAEMGGRMIVQALQAATSGPLARTPQPEQGISYAHKIDKAEAQLDWRLPAQTLARRVRAFNPFPGAASSVQGEMVKLWRVEPVDGRGEPGCILSVDEQGLTVACGAGALRLLELQRAGGKRLPAAQFLHGFALAPGTRFDLPREDGLMFWQHRLRTHPEFRIGALEMLPQLPGLAAWGLMTGVAMVKAGLSVPEALAMALLVYAGSSQLAALPLMVAGAPVWVILATGFCVNLRFVVFSLHLRDYLMHLPRLERLVTGYLSTDMGYVLLTRRHPTPAPDAAGRLARVAYLAGSTGIGWACWMVPSLAGVVLANFIPPHWGLGFAGILCLVGIMCSLASTRLRVVSMAVAGAVGVAAYALPLKLNIVLAIGAAVLACLMLEHGLGRRKAAA